MEEFATEEQQVEAIKRFWRENGLAIAVGVILGVGGLYGWRYYNDTQIAEKEAASRSYEQLSATLTSENTQKAEAFVAGNKGGYSILTALQLAKLSVEEGDLEKAASHLKYVANNADDEAIKSVANLRLARVQNSLSQFDQAMASLDLVTQPAFVAQVDEIKGDIYVNQSKFDAAKEAYSASLDANANNQLVKMKLDNLAVVING
ncbi:MULTISPECIES: YfgM family protein [Alteromonadaceae]|uniref:YfgM family protein n=1 Tax=Alteromonadaceae TaxID=72275 RepID=UPI001C0A590D|nr:MULTISPECIES: tetratricopeptide repeat protein [Aliiglaciecola]MBU2877884.1 tetratricopeptide repeat protein [Aliiglaciecola lipolytica]MDO6709247.1 tetratricopeptide repeat protein [Aliiglaciecola sp. 2_MG-2023]MDO6750395.1 tetratricopeptide repeat protein [Aliiglaciecola sp. 1_MG-2023]